MQTRVSCSLLLVFLLFVFYLTGSAFVSASAEDSTDCPIVGDICVCCLKNEILSMIRLSLDSYLANAFPLDELRPLTCDGHDNYGGLSVTLIDSLDLLALTGNTAEFSSACDWVSRTLAVRLAQNVTVSVFETNIRILGGLISAHLLADDESLGLWKPDSYRWYDISNNLCKLIHHRHGNLIVCDERIGPYNGHLLLLAEDLGRRLLAAFDTMTGIPFGSVSLSDGVPLGETTITSTAGAGTFLLEMGVLSVLTGDSSFETAALASSMSVWRRRNSETGLLGNHIDISTGVWTHKDSGIGGSMDSYFEYLLKGTTLFGYSSTLTAFSQVYESVIKHTRTSSGWFLEVNMDSGGIVFPIFNALQSFWPGMETLLGPGPSLNRARETLFNFYSVWRHMGFTPEGFNLASASPHPGQRGYPLRPELAESAYYLYRATKDPVFLGVGRDIVTSLNLSSEAESVGSRGPRVACGFAAINDVETRELDNRMESFFLSETLKYLYLLFDDQNLLHTMHSRVTSEHDDNSGMSKFGNAVGYIFTTEGHPLPLLPGLHKNMRRNVQNEVDIDIIETRIKLNDLFWGRGVCPIPTFYERMSSSGFHINEETASSVGRYVKLQMADCRVRESRMTRSYRGGRWGVLR